jgi:penicillin amidase
MNHSSKTILEKLGAGTSITQVCDEAGVSRAQFETWWQSEIRSRVPEPAGVRRAAVRGPVQIERDLWGIPHIYADNDEDLFFGFGYALAQDRLFQLDLLRRRGQGRLAEILGADGAELDLLARVVGIRSVLELDLLARTVGIRQAAEAEWTTLPEETRALVAAFSRGINTLMEESRGQLPIEFDLLGYEPDSWTPVDCLTIEGEFRWYLTGRFPVLVIPELAKRALGDGPLFRAFLHAEEGDESILPPGSYPRARCGIQPVGVSASDPDSALGSNNWVVAGTRTNTSKPLLASDPHIAFDAVSCWYEAHLCGGTFNVAGAAYVGMPAILFGRNERVAWGCTNNICSQRDLYQEKTDPAHPGCFLFDGRWEPAREREEVIQVKGGAHVRMTICSSRNGPIVNEVLPPIARLAEPVSLKWLGASHGGWLTALLGMNRARSAEEVRERLRPWHVPTFNVVFADVEGRIGYQTTGRIPLRKVWERGYRSGWDPTHQWEGLIPFEGMPRLTDPEQGWIATANNRVAPNDFPYPLSGTWSDGLRARRIRQMIDANRCLARADFGVMQQDSLSLRAVRCLPGLLKVLTGCSDGRIQEAASHLRAWDNRMETDRVGASLFEVFFAHWTKAVMNEHFPEDLAVFLAGGANGLAAALLTEDAHSWLAAGRREQVAQAAMSAALAWLTDRLGPNMAEWSWGRLHTLSLRHALSGRGDLGQLLDHGGLAVPGNAHTVCNTGLGSRFESRTGANYRLVADLSTAPPGLWAVDSQSQSGHPGSTHYSDQLSTWLRGEFHYLPLDRNDASPMVVSKLALEPMPM